jgi:ATP-dependent protease HslVU (ClpYQ) peptidase subunit
VTTLVGYARGRHTLMATDTATNVYDRPIYSAEKVVRCTTDGKDGSYLLGFAGEGAGPSVARGRHGVACMPDFTDPGDRNGWADAIARALTELFIEHQLVEGQRIDGTMLLAAGGHLWTLTHHQAIAHPDGMAAIGSGEGPSLGALHALIGAGRAPAKAIARACEIGILLDRYSGGEAVVHSV